MAAAPMTGLVKDELARVAVGKLCCRRVQATVLLRLAATVHRVQGQIELRVDLDHGPTAQRLGIDIGEVFGHRRAVWVRVLRDGGSYRRQWRVGVHVDAHSLAAQVGLAGCGGHPVRGLGYQMLYGPACDAAAAWRGALLASGSLSEPGQPPALAVSHPATQIAVAVALVGAARRLGVTATTRTIRGTEQIVIADPDAITALLTRLGAPGSARAWQARRLRHHAAAARVPTFEAANADRAARAGAAGAARARVALEVLAADVAAGAVPAHLLAAARLRAAHPHASLAELADMAEPRLSKDTLAGRLRRLLAIADTPTHRPGVAATGPQSGELP